MASFEEIIAAATSYTYFDDRSESGVALKGELGSVAVFADGNVENASTIQGHPTYPGYTGIFELERAKKFAIQLLNQ